MKDSLYIKCTVKDGALDFPNKGTKGKFDRFIKNLPDATKLEMFISASSSNGSLPQLARVHAMIREIANEIGYTFEEMKLTVKRQTGMCIVKNGVEYCKSFADCDKAELNMVIQTCIEIGDFNGMQLR